MIQVTKRVEFCAAHRYANPRWSEEENQRVFGKCGNVHGHNYILEVTVEGQPSPDTGMVIDLKALKDLIVEAVVDRFDHKDLNQDVPYFKEKNPTPENLAVVIWELLEPRLEGPRGHRLHRIRLHEDGSFFVDYYGERARHAERI
ncbi:MAG: 6-carboxytetrahydropterin synthase [candidate division NC10 bacterium]|nr:6-carboxytetrahydropterin synthase [candidate division NC10 bacterium]